MLKEKDIVENDLGKEAPLLNSIPKDNPFAVPADYFEVLPAQILEKCRHSTKHAPVSVSDRIFWLFRPQWMVAAFILVAGVCFFLRNGANNTIQDYQTLAAAIPDSVIVQNLQNNIDNVDMSSLEDLAQNTNIANSLPQAPSVDTSSGQIINYLMNNNIDASDIENEL